MTRGGNDIGAASLEPEILASADDRPGEEHRPVRLADVPLVFLNAMLAAEDHRFFEHGGLDARGLIRAAWTNLRAGRVMQGGSTITQQLIKNRLLGARRTFWRKLNEAWLATLVEWRYSKQQILEAYLNEIYLGQRGGLAVRGVGAAARVYFRKEIHQLTPAEAALLAGMVRAPNSYSPAVDPERARARRDVVLARMRELGMLSAADCEAARAEPVRVPPAATAAQPAPYFTDYVRLELEQRFGRRRARTSARSVYTSLDLGPAALRRGGGGARPRSAGDAVAAARRRDDPARRLQAALVALDPTTGEIRALVGGRDYQVSQFNRAALARRQPGSAFKPFVYLAALRARGGTARAHRRLDRGGLADHADGRPRHLEPAQLQRSLRGPGDACAARWSCRSTPPPSASRRSVGLPAVIETARALGLERRARRRCRRSRSAPSRRRRSSWPAPTCRSSTAACGRAGVIAVRAVRDRDGRVDPGRRRASRSAVITPAEAYLDDLAAGGRDRSPAPARPRARSA